MTGFVELELHEMSSALLKYCTKVVGSFLLRLNIGMRAIVNKYREGKLKRTLRRGCKEPEITKVNGIFISFCHRDAVFSSL